MPHKTLIGFAAVVLFLGVPTTRAAAVPRQMTTDWHPACWFGTAPPNGQESASSKCWSSLDDFSRGGWSRGWASPQNTLIPVTHCGRDRLLGGYEQLTSGNSTQKTYDFHVSEALPISHVRVRVRARIKLIDDWSDEGMLLSLVGDGETRWTYRGARGDQNDAPAGGEQTCGG
jgi:hypothetical protein